MYACNEWQFAKLIMKENNLGTTVVLPNIERKKKVDITSNGFFNLKTDNAIVLLFYFWKPA